MTEKDEQAQFYSFVKFVVAVVLVVGVLLMAGCPYYGVYKQGLHGKAEFARAEQNRRIKIEEAQAIKESASLLAEAEVIRAGGVKQANDIIAQGLGGPEGYLRYLYIQTLQDSQNQIIYIPTEAAMPLLEAGQR